MKFLTKSAKEGDDATAMRTPEQDSRTTEALLGRARGPRVQLALGGLLPRRGAGDLEDELGGVEQDLEVDLLPEVVRVDRGLDARVCRGGVLEGRHAVNPAAQDARIYGAENARWTRARGGG